MGMRCDHSYELLGFLGIKDASATCALFECSKCLIKVRSSWSEQIMSNFDFTGANADEFVTHFPE